MSRFNVEARLHRLVGRSRTVREVIWIRRYSRIETAVRRGTEFLMIEGQVGDTIEFSLMKLGQMQVGTLRYKASGEIEVVWNDSEAKKLRNQLLKLNPPALRLVA